MASLTLVLLLFISLQICGPIVGFDVNGLQLDSAGSTENGDPCKDCTKIFELMSDLLSSQELQKKIVDELEGLCKHLPGPVSTKKLCEEEVEKMLPVAIHFITSVAKPAELCKMLGLCHSSCDKQQKMLDYFVKEALDAAVQSENALEKSTCTFCLFLMKTLEGLLPKQRTEDAVIHLLEDICHILPAGYQKQCEGMVGKFSKTILDAILSYATPHSICVLLHLCSQEATALDPCTVETYRCRDLNTALRCGTLFYCQRFAWKPLNNIY